MTNEDIAAAIQAGGADDLKPVLYDRVKHLMYKLCGQYYAQHRERFTACGAELADLRQECYPAFIKALEGYKPANGLLFTSYLTLPIKNAANAMLGIRNKDSYNSKPLDNCTSLDKAIETEDGEIMLRDVVPDETAEQAFEQAIDRIHDEQVREVLKKALELLEKPQRDAIVLIYFEDLTLQQAGERMGISRARVTQIKQKALKRLRRNPNVWILREEQYIDRYLHFRSGCYSKSFFKAQELVNAIERRGQYLSYGKRQAIIYDCLVRSALDIDGFV